MSMTYRQLSTEERFQIAALRQAGSSNAEIATILGRHRGTIDRELRRNATPHDGAYRPSFAAEMTSGRRRRSRRNARFGPQHFVLIIRLLRRRWSPEQIVGRLRRLGRPVMSHETIYVWIWQDKKRGGNLWTYLRGAAKRRRKRYGRKDSRGRLAGKRMVQDRPDIVARRGRFGDWEADTVHGQGKPCIATAVERKSGLVRIGPLARPTVEHTNACLITLLSRERHPVHTITSDNGVEFHGYKAIEQALDTTFFFATPHHAWERGTNENTNGLIRQYLPKGTPLGHLRR
jgi:IS30 family transposase